MSIKYWAEQGFWITKSGEKIKLTELKNSHLINIVSMLEKCCKDGVEIKSLVCEQCVNYDYDNYGVCQGHIATGKKARQVVGLDIFLKELRNRELNTKV